MFTELAQQISNQLQNLYYLILVINAILHLIFAGAVARDGGRLNKLSLQTALVSAPVWAFATLVGGVVTAAIYWFIHHSTLTRPSTQRDR
jgi:ATP/ADP translocase